MTIVKRLRANQTLDNTIKRIMPNSKFLEQYPLYRKFSIEIPEASSIPQPPINMFCSLCKSEQTFLMPDPYYSMDTIRESGHVKSFGISNNRSHSRKACVLRADYTCAACEEYQINFLLRFDENLISVMKVGQYPPWKIEVDKNLSKLLGEHRDNYQKGLICESQSYGIGAYAYYRRIVEDIIDELLESISDLMTESEKKIYEKALEEARKSIVAQEKIALVKDLLPASLRPNNMNPLRLLHTRLSVGIHDKTDEECLEIAVLIREILIYLVNQIIQSKESSKRFTESMKKLLDKRNTIQNSKT